ncbi:MAG: TIGR01457 family HAD-type hydrolase [Paenibacillus dendritiformis]|uniref:TIGR01457 family HAD-type hydrolase n=1 Tax=Paenibacillus dendritiformis TaxID=130049 RepID=UPI00143DAB0D|nr:TIGR01457 family HAD-type hydrolase [Paenibacillus dendritiformis]MDU5140708.1 TIGR01457 family HAD-type hydrolase [Paenibacillus dendritiformis]NKI22997.1 TIGR01457 family HAD-type hydrolase [Paenibacillus dendritiformis]NRF97723.1 TIGR01457 family HAD-type hydrolase [Paenibacillus dendritiformis]GIO71018.1 haloacid dehalogenase [Paenibacillus dendritiformis]
MMDTKWHACIDLDGTMYHGSAMIEGADALISTLQQLRIPYQFVTNNSSRTPEEVADMLNRLGINAKSQDVLTSAQAAASYILKKFPGRHVFMIGERGLEQALTDAGVQWTADVEAVWNEEVDIVVQGIDRSLSYAKLEAAAAAVRKGALSILTNPDLMLPSDRGFSPGAGSIGAAIQAASGVEPVVIGKPSRIIMDAALERLGCRAEEAIVIGDNMMTDMLAGHQAGCRTALVLTGITTAANRMDYQKRSGVNPDMICETLDELRQWFMEQAHNNE